MTARKLRIIWLLALPLLLALSQCKPKDPTPPVPKVDAPGAPAPIQQGVPDPSATSGH